MEHTNEEPVNTRSRHVIKTILCRNQQQGICRRGELCNYWHRCSLRYNCPKKNMGCEYHHPGEPEINCYKGLACRTHGCMKHHVKTIRDPSNYKTYLCKYQINGKCVMDDNCTYWHDCLEGNNCLTKGITCELHHPNEPNYKCFKGSNCDVDNCKKYHQNSTNNYKNKSSTNILNTDTLKMFNLSQKDLSDLMKPDSSDFSEIYELKLLKTAFMLGFKKGKESAELKKQLPPFHKLCRLQQKGMCQFGDACTFWHTCENMENCFNKNKGCPYRHIGEPFEKCNFGYKCNNSECKRHHVKKPALSQSDTLLQFFNHSESDTSEIFQIDLDDLKKLTIDSEDDTVDLEDNTVDLEKMIYSTFVLDENLSSPAIC
jgi:hypothetical protein